MASIRIDGAQPLSHASPLIAHRLYLFDLKKKGRYVKEDVKSFTKERNEKGYYTITITFEDAIWQVQNIREQPAEFYAEYLIEAEKKENE